MAKKFAKLPASSFVGMANDVGFGNEEADQKRQEMENPKPPAPRVFARGPFSPGVEKELTEVIGFLRGLYSRAEEVEPYDALIFAEFGLDIHYTAACLPVRAALDVLGVKHPVSLWRMLDGTATALHYSGEYRRAHGADTRYPGMWTQWAERAEPYLFALSTQEGEEAEAGYLLRGLRDLIRVENK